jgi:hypothetical protein
MVESKGSPKGSACEALARMASENPDSDHMVIESHDRGFTTHHRMSGERAQGPNHHRSMAALKKHIATAMDEDGE